LRSYRLVTAALLAGALSFLFFLSGCHSRKPANARNFAVQGRVVAIDSGAHTLTVDLNEIPGYMKAMTMEYPVHDSDNWVFDVVHPGDTLQGTLVVTGSDAYLQGLSVTQGRGQADLSSTSPIHLPQVGDVVPDFHFTDQNGHPIHLAQFRGQPLLLTFIYTRCPLPNYCVRMSGNFVEIEKRLRHSNPAAFAKLRLLSITLDPAFDDPKVLRTYGKAYAGSIDPGLRHWTLATAPAGKIRQAAEFFGMAYESKNGEVVHNLRTALLDPDGRVAAFYSGNKWKPDEVADQLVQLQR
jgi:protein SCO1/2